MPQENEELTRLAEILDAWLRAAPTVPEIYLFGSRVRGDHRADSDVDVRLFVDQWQLDHSDMVWWLKENRTDFAALKERLPGPLAIHREKWDAADAAILEGKKEPALVVGRVVCVKTPKK